jgi:hypothetical protein
MSTRYRHRVVAWALPALAVATSACGAPPAGDHAPTVQVGPDVTVVIDSSAPFVRAADFRDRTERTIDVALRYWGGTWEDLRARRITLVDGASVPCHGQPALGCWDGDILITTRDPGVGTVACIEETVLVHEIGHAVIGDPDHRDPRWMQMDEVAQALDGGLGYGAAGTVPCVAHVSVWRHPLGLP